MNNSDIKYRHEYKYVINEFQMAILKQRVKTILSPDPHTSADEHYSIRSLYFDDYRNRCFYENENGIDPRKKFRIRVYNSDFNHIVLECKKKEHGKTLKESCKLDIETAQHLIKSKSPPLKNINSELLIKLSADIKLNLMKPVVIVEYLRFPYIYKNGNVRVTFDTNISTCSNYNTFFSEKIFCRPIMNVREHIMEVKFDDFLPDYIYKTLNLGSLTHSTFSKYYLSRKFSKIN